MHPMVMQTQTAEQRSWREIPARSGEIADDEAVNSVLAGNREMFEIVVRRYNPLLYRVGMAHLRDHAQAEDAMQEAWIKAFLKLDSFKGGAAFSTWLTRIMINECLMTIRRRNRFRTETGTNDSDRAAGESLAPPAIEILNAKEVKALLEQSIQELPRAHRTVYVLREVQGLSTAETAACLGISESNVKVSLHRAREELKARILRTAAGVELFEYTAPCCDPMTARVMASIRALG